MLILSAKNYKFGNPSVTKLVVVGHFAYVFWNKGEGAYLNLKDPTGCLVYADSLGISEAVNHLIDNILPSVGNWGDDEKDYEKAVVSDEWQVRTLVAINGKFGELLAGDKHYMPRKAVISRFITVKQAGGMLGETYFLDELVNDSSEEVRYELAVLGLADHTPTLIHDRSQKVAQEVIAKAHTGLLDLLLDGDCIPSKVSFANNKNASEAQLAILSLEKSEEVQLAVAKNVHFYNLCQSPYVSVRKAIASHSEPHQIKILAHDKDDEVRAIVASRGVAHEVLHCDPSTKVRLALTKVANAETLSELINDSDKLVAAEAAKMLKSLANHKAVQVSQTS